MSGTGVSLLNRLAWEFRLQRRYYFWTVGLIVSVVWLSLLLFMNEAARERWLPVIIFADLSNIGLLFIAGMLYLERRQGTLFAMAVTPVSPGAWYLQKLVCLTVLTTACAVALALFASLSASWVYLLPATILTAALFTCCGFLLALPFDGIMNYFLAMAVCLAVLNLPLFDYFGVIDSPFMWLLPTQPALLALGGSLQGMPAMQFVLTVSILLLWVVALYLLGVRRFRGYLALRPQA